MKIIKIEENNSVVKKTPLEAIHDFAKANGSQFKMEFETENNQSWCCRVCKLSYSNRNYTVGYFALLYYIAFIDSNFVHAFINEDGFGFKINNEEEFIKLIS